MTQRIYQSLLAPLPPVPPGNVWDMLLQNLTEERRTAKEPIFIDSNNDAGINMPTLLERVKYLSQALYHHPRLSNARTATETKDLQTIGIFSPTHLDYPTIVYSAFASGVPFMPTPSTSTKSEAEHVFQLSHAGIFFVHPTLLSRALEAGLSKNQIVLMEPMKGWNGDTVDSLVEKGKQAPDFRKDGKYPVPACGLSHIMLSSGSTGKPKGVMLTHENLKASLMQIAISGMMAAVAIERTTGKPLLKPGERAVMLANIPFYHVYGMMGYALRAMTGPTTVVLFHKWNLQLAVKAIEKYQVTMLTLVPAIVTQFLASPEIVNKADLSSIRNVVVGGGATTAEPKRRFMELFAARGHLEGGERGYYEQRVILSSASISFNITALLMPGRLTRYGMSEATVAITGWPVKGMPSGPPRPGTAGCLLPSNEVRLVKTDWTDPEGVDVAEGESGELLLRGPAVMKGYLDNPEANEKVFTPGGWLKTGDELRIEADGQLFYVDRLGDVYKTNGLQVAPSEITTTIRHSLPDIVADCVVIGMPAAPSRAQIGNEAWAFVILTSPAAAKMKKGGIRKNEKKRFEDMIKAVVKENLARHKWVAEVRFLQEFPIGPTGKVLVRQIKADALEKMEQKAKL